MKKAATLSFFVLSVLALYLVSLYSNFFNKNKVLFPLETGLSFRIDFFGAILPLVLGIFCIAMYLIEGLPKISYIVCFLLSLAIALQVSKPAAGGLMSNPAIFSSVVSLCVVSLVNFFMRLNHNSIWTLKKSYFASLLVGGGCVPFSLIIVDLYYVRFFNRSIIGGNGLADGVILSTIYEPLIITIIMAAFSIFLNLSSSTRKGKLTKAACG